MTRDDLERLCRQGAKAYYVGGPDTVLCRVLGDRPMYVDSRDRSLTPHLVMSGLWEPWITTAFLRDVKKGDRVIDVGANVGWYSLAALKAGGVLLGAIEPSPRCADLLDRTFELNGLSLKALRVAAWSASGEMLLLEQDNENLGGMSVMADRCERISVKTARLDDLFEEVDVIKIDVEGAEHAAWKGASRLTSRPGVRAFVEFTPISHKDPRGALAEIADGMELSLVDHGGHLREATIDRALEDAGEHWTMLHLRRRG